MWSIIGIHSFIYVPICIKTPSGAALHPSSCTLCAPFLALVDREAPQPDAIRSIPLLHVDAQSSTTPTSEGINIIHCFADPNTRVEFSLDNEVPQVCVNTKSKKIQKHKNMFRFGVNASRATSVFPRISLSGFVHWNIRSIFLLDVVTIAHRFHIIRSWSSRTLSLVRLKHTPL